MNEQKKLEIVEDAFRSGVGHSKFTCNCGKVFYNSNGKWDWEDGELEALQKSWATDLDYTVSTVSFEGTEYSADCSCWHGRALRIFNFLVSHNHKIIDFYRILKEHKLDEANNIELGDIEDND